MKRNPELEQHLRRVRPEETAADASVPDGFVARVMAARAAERERARTFTGTAAVAAVLAVAVLGALRLRNPGERQEPACAGWLEMEQETSNPWE
jgi:hypothetical protein